MSDEAEGLATSTGNRGPRNLAWYYQIQIDVVKCRKPPQRHNRDENNNDDRLSTYLRYKQKVAYVLRLKITT
jgi:hypothetical protein